MSEHAPQHLDYAPQTRRKARRRVVMTVVVLAIFAGLWKYGPPALDHAKLLYYQGRCMSYDPPADEVVQNQSKARNKTTLHALDKFYQLWSPPGRRPNTIVLVHGMKLPSGAPRLVIVESSLLGYPDSKVSFQAEAIEPITLFYHRRRSVITSSSGFVVKLPFTLYAAKLDEHDPSHFIIKLESSESGLVFDGWLLNDGRVVIEPRK